MKINKKALYPLILILAMFVVFQWRKSKKEELQHLSGQTMGTTYNIKYLGEYSFQAEVDSVLKAFNLSVSTYIPESEISVFNKTGELTYSSSYFYPVLQKSKEVYEKSGGAFDPTIMPLVNAWGFGFENKAEIDSSLIDSLLSRVDFSSISFDDKTAITSANQMLDFSAIAKGYGVDVLAEYLTAKGVPGYMVEIGGEVRCAGLNQDGYVWRIGIDNPEYSEKGGELLANVIELQNKALATSGNYRNFYVDNEGVKRAHTINPKTGYPVAHSLLSASVVANDCITADAYATAIMVLGVEKGKELVNETPEIEAFLVFDTSGTAETWRSEGFQLEKSQ